MHRYLLCPPPETPVLSRFDTNSSASFVMVRLTLTLASASSTTLHSGTATRQSPLFRRALLRALAGAPPFRFPFPSPTLWNTSLFLPLTGMHASPHNRKIRAQTVRGFCHFIICRAGECPPPLYDCYFSMTSIMAL